jgi:hypothetical protein
MHQPFVGRALRTPVLANEISEPAETATIT